MRFLLSCWPVLIAISLLFIQEKFTSIFVHGENSRESDFISDRNPKETGCSFSNPLEQALNLEPPVATSVEGGDTEGSEWWLEHEDLLRSAWNLWDELCKSGDSETDYAQGFPQLQPLDANLIDPDLRFAVDRTRHSPTVENEALVHEKWVEVFGSTASKEISPEISQSNSRRIPNDKYHSNLHRVYRYKNFLTRDGIQKLRSHLDAISNNGIPKRRPNAMNRNGLLLDPSIPGGVHGDLELQRFIELIADEYIRPLGRSLFPEFAGDTKDDVKHYAFTIKYGDDENIQQKNSAEFGATEKSISFNTSSIDWDLKEHSDASLYTLNINLNLPDEDYSGSSLYFVTQEGIKKTKSLSEISFESGTALLHRGMTKHGATPLEGGKRNNLVIWLYGIDGYVRIAPYEEGERLSLKERWSSQLEAEEKTEFVATLFP